MTAPESCLTAQGPLGRPTRDRCGNTLKATPSLLQLDLVLDWNTDLLCNRRPDVDVCRRCVDAYNHRVPRAEGTSISLRLFLPPPRHRIDADYAALRELGRTAVP